MRNALITGAIAASLALPTLSFAHGGTYRGPQDTVPPSGGGGGGGGGPPTPGGGAPGQPGMPGRPTTGAPMPAGSPGGSRGPAVPTGGGKASDPSTWDVWWAFNKDPFLALKARLAAHGVQTNSDEDFLGRERSQTRDTLRVSEQRVRSEIVPELLAALAQERSNDIQSSCMVALAKIGEERAEDGGAPISEAIRPFLASRSQELAETAAVALGILADPENLPWLVAVLENDLPTLRARGLEVAGAFSQRTRAFAAYGLGLIAFKASEGDRLAINATLRKLLDGEARTMAHRDVPVACLTALGLAPLAAHGEALDTARAPAALASLESQVAYLLRYFADASNNHLTRAHVPTAVARLVASAPAAEVEGLRQAVAEELLRALDARSSEPAVVQQGCAIALGILGDSDEDALDLSIRRALMRARTEARDQQTGHFALIALAQAAGRAGSGAGNPVYGADAAERRDNARSFLMGELARGKAGAEHWAGVALAVLERGLQDARGSGSTDALLALRGALADAGSPAAIGAFAVANGIAANAAAGPELLRHLERCEDPEARGYVAVGLGLIGERGALRPVQDLIRKSKYQPELLKSGAIALGLLGDREIVPDLVEMLDNATSLSSQAAVSSALGFLGDARSVDPLVRMLRTKEEHTDLARAFAAVSLGLIADKEALPWNSKLAVDSNYRANTETLTNQASGILDIL